MWTWESKHSSSHGSVKEAWMRNSGGNLTKKFVFSTSQSQFLKFVFSTSQINFNFCVFFMVPCLMRSMVLLLGLKWSWHQLPKCCWNQWPLHKVFVLLAPGPDCYICFINWAKYLHHHVPRFTQSQEMQVSHHHSILIKEGSRNRVTDTYFSAATREMFSTHQVLVLFE